jgi:hypothetical protein
MRVVFLLFLCLSAPSLLAQPTRSELLATPQYAEDSKPTYRKVTAAEFEKSIVAKAVVTENYGDRFHAVELSIPKGDNALHAVATLGTPRLRDGKGGTIEPDAFRFDVDPAGVFRVQYAKEADGATVANAAGDVRLRYPLEVTTRSIKAGEKGTWEKHGIEINGPYVRFDGHRLSSGRWGVGSRLIRAYDAAGKRLETAGEWVDDEGRMYVAAYGKVARADFDVPGELAAVHVAYDVNPQQPAAAPKVTVRRIASLPLAVLGDTPSYSEEQLRSYLESFTGTLDEQLFNAATQGDATAVRYLLVLGADPNAGSAVSPFAIAAMQGHIEVAEMLLDSGADLKRTDANGVTPLFSVMSACPPASLVQKMIDRGADVNAKGPAGVTILAMAAAVNCQDAVATLKKAGAK